MRRARGFASLILLFSIFGFVLTQELATTTLTTLMPTTTTTKILDATSHTYSAKNTPKSTQSTTSTTTTTTTTTPMPTKPPDWYRNNTYIWYHKNDWITCTSKRSRDMEKGVDDVRMVGWGAHFACYYVLNPDQRQPLGSLEQGIYYRNQVNNDRHVSVVTKIVCEQLFAGINFHSYTVGCHCVVSEGEHSSSSICCCLPAAFKIAMVELKQEYEGDE